MSPQQVPNRGRARILGRGLAVTLENPRSGSRTRVHVRSREGKTVEVEPIPGTGITPNLNPGASLLLRVARPFGLFCYAAEVIESSAGGITRLRLGTGPPKRRQLREYFRLPIRLSVHIEDRSSETPPSICRAYDLSAGGIMLEDENRRLFLADSVRLGLPIGPSGSILRLDGRVVRVQEDPRRVALAFDGIHEGARKAILHYLFREHRRRTRPGHRPGRRTGCVTSIHKST